MGQERREILKLEFIGNERGAMLAATIILLFFVSLFLFSIVMWHDNIYMQYASLEKYYEKRSIEVMKQGE